MKKTLIAAVAGLMMVPMLAPTPASAMAPCQVKPLFSVIEYQQTVAVYGVYTSAGAIDVQLTCGIVQNGVTVRRFSESIPGPVATLAGTATVSYSSFTACHELYVTYADRPPYTSDGCP